MKSSEHRAQSGHSLVELMLAVIVVMVLGAFAIPNVATTMANSCRLPSVPRWTLVCRARSPLGPVANYGFIVGRHGILFPESIARGGPPDVTRVPA